MVCQQKASKCKMLQKQVKCLSLSTYKLRGFAYSLALEVTQEEFEGRRKSYWEAITADYMSEESCHEEDVEQVMVKHTPKWRSR